MYEVVVCDCGLGETAIYPGAKVLYVNEIELELIKINRPQNSSNKNLPTNVHHMSLQAWHGPCWLRSWRSLHIPAPPSLCISFHLGTDSLRMSQSALLSAWYRTGQDERAIGQMPSTAGHTLSLSDFFKFRLAVSLTVSPRCHL